ncbi:hypothetical protein IMSHALPRED_005265 [Imshaugia aleurites]|uniref:RRM domain-containing protein n=1 Tax=Imshaugia aleurites TaxID=172621 RepID=A0A8H3J8L4_9LECA|nr:hypothetical protein IMSHALPRED_005265 [Imshaugia aleurites]
MGADLKRKEARKRKFGGEHLEGSSADEPLKKKSRQILQPAFPEKAAVVGENGKSATLKAQRFIVFIGNLPYTATDESISKHFAKIKPKSIRHRKAKDTGISKGFAFLEFEGFDRMKTCLRLYHHSNFDDGASPARKLNVELTAGGGGGKSKDRKNKLRTKNERLGEQRMRRNQEEEKQKRLSINDSQPRHALGDNGDVHPSRRSRVARPT